MNVRVREMLEGAIQSVGIEELFETGKHISVDIFSDEYMGKINAIQLQNTKIKILQRLLSYAISKFKKVNKIKGVEFADRLKRVVDAYNNRRRESYADWSTRDDIKADLQVDLILLMDEFDYPPVTRDDVYEEVLEQAENFKKYAEQI